MRFTRNSPDDAGYWFQHSSLPLVSDSREHLDGKSWGYWSSSTGHDISTWMRPDQPGAGYATAWFDIEIPYDTEGHIAYALARVKLESEFINTQMAWWWSSTYSPLRLRAGSDQPCLSITMQGGVDGKFRKMDLPFTDTGFTERDWKQGDTDDAGKSIKEVIVGSLNFNAIGWPENVEGKTNLSGGASAYGAFVMVDKSDGHSESETSKVHINLVENVDGEVSLGFSFSTNGGILNDRDKAAFDAAIGPEQGRFDGEVSQGESDRADVDEAWTNSPIGP